MRSTLPDNSTRPATVPRPASPGDPRDIDEAPAGGSARAASVAKDMPVANADRAAEGAAKFDGGGDQRVEHRLQIESRAADDLQHLGGGGLLLQRFGEVAGARLHLVEQPHVLDRDHRLVGEGLDDFDLAIREGDRLVARDSENADGLPVANQRDP